jgi:hypothetical protein
MHADIFTDRYKSSAVGMGDIRAADLMLFLADAQEAMSRENHRPKWYPLTLLLVEDRSRPLDIFARAESRKFADQLARAIGAADAEGLKKLIAHVLQSDWNPRSGHFGINISGLTNAERMAVYP